MERPPKLFRSGHLATTPRPSSPCGLAGHHRPALDSDRALLCALDGHPPPQGLDFLLCAKDHGVCFERTMTIGPQFLLCRPRGWPSEWDQPLRSLPTARVRRPAHRTSRRHGGVFPRHLEFRGPRWSTTSTCPSRRTSGGGSRRWSTVASSSTSSIFRRAIGNAMDFCRGGRPFPGISPTNNAAGHGSYQVQPRSFLPHPVSGQRLRVATVAPRRGVSGRHLVPGGRPRSAPTCTGRGPDPTAPPIHRVRKHA